MRMVAGTWQQQAPSPLRFPGFLGNAVSSKRNRSVAGEQALDAVDRMSRRIDDLARELNCLGFFSDDDQPRAA